MWQHDMYENDSRPTKRARPVSGGTTGTSGKLHISNLDFGVSESDIQVWTSKILNDKLFPCIVSQSSR